MQEVKTPNVDSLFAGYASRRRDGRVGYHQSLFAPGKDPP